MKLIDKDALVAEIEDWRDKIRKGIFDIPLTGSDRAYATFEYEILGKIKDFIDTLEMKGVQEELVNNDLEEAAEQYAKDYLFTPAPTRSLTDHFKAGAKWQKQQATNNNIWHSIDEKADGNKFVVLYDVEGGYMSPPSRSAFGFDSDFINAMNKKYGANYTMWAYKDDLTPKKED